MSKHGFGLLAVLHSSENASTGQHLFGLESQIMHERKGYIPDKQATSDDSRSMYKKINQCGLKDLSECYEAVAGNVADLTEQLHSDRPGCEYQKAIDACHIKSEESAQKAVTGNVAALTDQLHSDRTGCEYQKSIDACHIKSEESDLFKKHFCSLSSTHKVCTLWNLNLVTSCLGGALLCRN